MASHRPLILAALLVTIVACAPASQSNVGPGASGQPGASLGWYDELTGEHDKLDVATTVAPISSIARNIGGDAHPPPRHRPRRDQLPYVRAEPVRCARPAHAGTSSSSTGCTSSSRRWTSPKPRSGRRRPILLLGDNTVTRGRVALRLQLPRGGRRPQSASVDERSPTRCEYARAHARLVLARRTPRTPPTTRPTSTRSRPPR